jgi:hypothetical protein
MSVIEVPEVLKVSEGVQAPKISPGRRAQHSGDKIASILSKTGAAQSGKVPSLRGLAREVGVAESTIRYWMNRKSKHHLDAQTVAFLESPAGVRFLQRQMVAQHFVFGLMGGCGPSLHRYFLQLTGLHTFVACSNTTLRSLMRKLLDTVVTWGDQAKTDLAKTMPLRKVSLGVDETFFADMVLVAMDVAAGFIISEKSSAHRDTDTWEEHVRSGVKGLNVELVQVVGDGAKALNALAKDRLKIPKIDDLWHGQSAITRGTSAALASKVKAADTKLDQACKDWGQIVSSRKKYDQQTHGRGRPPAWAAREVRAQQEADAAESALYRAIENQDAVQKCVCDLGIILHPVDLKTGELQDATKVQSELQKTFDRVEIVVKEAGLGERSQAAVRKAKRLLPSWVASVNQWHEMLKNCLSDMKLTAAVLALFHNVLIPLLYLQRVIGQTRDTERRKELQKVQEKLHGVFMESTGIWQALPAELRRSLLAVAQDCVDLFQRSTGCVEGRNGVLSLHQHQMRGLNPQALTALTVVHNFVNTRCDGSTAALRFFGRAPDKPLFEHLCQVLPLPARPRKRLRRPVVNLIIASAA